MTRTLALACAALLPAAGAAQPLTTATGPDGRSPAPYAFVRLGAIVPQHDDLDVYEAGPALEIGAGFPLGPHAAVEAAMGRLAMSGSTSWTDPVGGRESLDVRLTAIPITGTLRLGVPLGSLELHALAGAGVYFLSERVDLSRPNLAGGSFSGSDDDTTFGFHAGVGASVAITPRLLLGGDVRWLFASSGTFDAQSRIDSLVMTAGLGYRFR